MTNYGFPKSSRLLSSSDYQQVFDQSRLKVSTANILFLARFNQLPQGRMGLVIAKKNVRLAAQRNRIKRVLRESFRSNPELTAGLDIVVLARRGLDTLGNRELHQTCEQLWQQLRQRADKKQQSGG